MEPEGWLTQRNIEPAKTSALEGSGLKILRALPDAASIEDRDPGRTYPPRANPPPLARLRLRAREMRGALRPERPNSRLSPIQIELRTDAGRHAHVCGPAKAGDAQHPCPRSSLCNQLGQQPDSLYALRHRLQDGLHHGLQALLHRLQARLHRLQALL